MDQVIIRKRARTVNEVDMADVKKKELSLAQQEFFNLQDELFNMVDNLTLVQFQKVNEKVRELINTFELNK